MATGVGNTTTTPLGSSVTFTGGWEQSPHPDVMVSCQTDNTGTLYFDFSVDGENYSTFPVSGFLVASGVHEFHTAVKGPRHFRVRLVNDSGAQSYLRLYTYYGAYRQSNAPLNQTIGADADAIIVRSVDSKIDLELGRFSGYQSRRKFGYSTGLGTAIQLGTPATWVDLWSYGGLRTSPTTTFTPYMASTSGTDTNVDVTWQYLDANGNEQTVTVNTNGTSSVSLGVTAQEVYRGYVSGATACVGSIACITADNFSTGSPVAQAEVLAQIKPADQQTQVLAFRVPAGKTCLLRTLEILCARASGAAGTVDLALEIRLTGGVWRAILPIQMTTSHVVVQAVDFILPALSDVRVRIRDVSDTVTSVSGDIHSIFVDV